MPGYTAFIHYIQHTYTYNSWSLKELKDELKILTMYVLYIVV